MTDVSRVFTQNGKVLYYVTNVTDAPLCQCELPSVVLIGVNGQGKLYAIYVCSRNTNELWREKCDFKDLVRDKQAA